MIQYNFFNRSEPGIFKPIFDSLVHQGDKYCLLADYASYIEAQDRVSAEFLNRKSWTEKAIINVANVGKFSSDRTIHEYAEEIWNVKPVKIVD